MPTAIFRQEPAVPHKTGQAACVAVAYTLSWALAGQSTPQFFERSLNMGSESLQHKLDRVRRPRVQITYDVETGGAMRSVELPFVVGVLADMSGQPKEALKPLKD